MAGVTFREAARKKLLLMALLCFAGSRLVAGGQRHAYNAGATPLPTYHLTAGTIYQLSSVGGVQALTQSGVLGSGLAPSCFSSSNGGPDSPIAITSTKDDARDLHVFATFSVESSGDFHIRCQGISEVFVDDADNVGFDLAALLMLLSTAFGVLGLAAAVSGGYGLSEDRVDLADTSEDALI